MTPASRQGRWRSAPPRVCLAHHRPARRSPPVDEGVRAVAELKSPTWLSLAGCSPKNDSARVRDSTRVCGVSRSIPACEQRCPNVEGSCSVGFGCWDELRVLRRGRTDMCNVLCTCEANRGCSGELYGGEPPVSLPGGLEKEPIAWSGLMSPLADSPCSTPSTFRRCTPTTPVSPRDHTLASPRPLRGC